MKTKTPYSAKASLCSRVVQVARMAVAAGVAAMAAACGQTARYTTVDGAMLGTTFHIVARTDMTPKQIYAEVMRIDAEAKASMSIFEPDSRLNRINANLTDTLDCHIKRNIEVARTIHRISGGAYDITVKPLTEAYGFAAKGKIDHPNTDSIMEFVGFDRLRVEGDRIIKSDSRVEIDLNSIAKGYTVDMVAQMMEASGCENYIVEIGGEIRARGVNAEGRRWRVAVDSPFDGNDAPGTFRQTVVEVSEAALATSGNYRRYYMDAQGRKIAHTINPKTGQSVVSRLLSATVVAQDCTTADALGTMFMALGDKRAIELAQEMRDSVQVYFILAPQSTPRNRNSADGAVACGASADGAVAGDTSAVQTGSEGVDYEIFSTLKD